MSKRPCSWGMWVISLLVLGFVVGCAVEQGRMRVRDGKRYGTVPGMWRARWWNYYQRGASYLDGEYWREATADFQAALKQHRGRKDRRRARTYGVHYLDYFPHRDLGIAYYHLGQYSAAQRELETSLSTVDTAKAKFYLNKVRKVLLEQSGQDTSPPRIAIETPTETLVTNADTLTVRGYVEDDTYVSAVSIAKQPLFIELAEPRLDFDHEVTLSDGANTIDIVAVDLLGQPTRKRLIVHLDREGPLVSLIEAKATGQQVRIEGGVFDNSRVTRFVLGGRLVSPHAEKSWEFHEEIALGDGMDAVPFEAEDAAGNITRGRIDLSTATRTKQAHRKHNPGYDPLQRWASVDPAAVMFDTGFRWMAQGGGSRPSIELRGLLSQEATATTDAPLTLSDNTVYLEGKISASSAITRFAINGKPCWERKSKQLFFGHKIVLKPGDNRLTLEAVDEQGNKQTYEVVITHAVQKIKQLDTRLRLVLLPFELKGTPSELSQTVYDNFLKAMVDQERFGLVSTTKLNTILQQLDLSRADLIKPSAYTKVGKQAEAEGVVIGVVTENQQGLQVLAHYMDVASSELSASLDIYGEGLSLPQLQTLIEGLAWKFKQRFPISEGFVLKTEGKRIFVDLGAPHGMKKNMKLVIFRDGEEIKHPITGKVLHTETEIVAEAKIDGVFDDVSRAVLLKSEAASEVKQLDRVITK
ncbi:MAG: hypothetical protein OEU26_04055 [Candidatus Tectomicrobia bacterium]|nr:hypothetical protein [Candidatus Tectomicrobia bacterium]